MWRGQRCADQPRFDSRVVDQAARPIVSFHQERKSMTDRYNQEYKTHFRWRNVTIPLLLVTSLDNSRGVKQ
jgi:hypothetical protein